MKALLLITGLLFNVSFCFYPAKTIKPTYKISSSKTIIKPQQVNSEPARKGFIYSAMLKNKASQLPNRKSIDNKN